MLVIIRIQIKALDEMDHDIIRLSKAGFTGIRFEIPQVRVLKRTVHKEDIFEYKPILFNYGFMELPIEYARNPLILNRIRQLSEVISGWFYRKPAELQEERLQMEAEGLEKFVPSLVKSITEDELNILYAEAKKLDVYDGSDNLSPGSFVVLQKYPFNGLSAKILRKKTNGKIQVELLDSGISMWLDRGSILYTPYSEEDSYKD